MNIHSMTNHELEAVSDALADVLCWFQGFNAARPLDAPNVEPYGLDTLRELNIQIKKALNRRERQGTGL